MMFVSQINRGVYAVGSLVYFLAAGHVMAQEKNLLTAPGQWVLEPSLSVAHASSTEVAIEGLTIIPALVIGLINVSEAQREVTTTAITLRTGIFSGMETSLKLPWLYVNESIRERQAFNASPIDIISDSSGQGVGDIEWMLNAQLSNGIGAGPHWFSSLRVRAPTGTSPFEVDQRTLSDGDGVAIGSVLDEQPTGSGFWSVQPGVSFTLASDPAVLYGGLGYQFNLADDKGDKFGGRIDPGDAMVVNMGMGLALNEATSFSLGYEHTLLKETTLDGPARLVDARFDRLHAASLLIGLTHAVDDAVALNLTLAVGVTENAPDMQFTVRAPFAL